MIDNTFNLVVKNETSYEYGKKILYNQDDSTYFNSRPYYISKAVAAQFYVKSTKKRIHTKSVI